MTCRYRITRGPPDRFAQTLDSLRQRPGEAGLVRPIIANAQEDALRSQLADLEGELCGKVSPKTGKFPIDVFSMVAELTTVLTEHGCPKASGEVGVVGYDHRLRVLPVESVHQQTSSKVDVRPFLLRVPNQAARTAVRSWSATPRCRHRR